MVDVLVLGYIEGIRVSGEFVTMRVSVRRAGYRKRDGTVYKDEFLVYRVLFQGYMRRYISSSFSSGMLVKIKGHMLPYAKDGGGNIIDGYTILGQTLEHGVYPSSSARLASRVRKDSLEHDVGVPDVENYMSDDF